MKQLLKRWNQKNHFKEHNVICKESTIFASNTSGLSITEIASATNRREKVIGMHFFNPVPVMKLVEIIKGQETSEESFGIVNNLVESFGKVRILINIFGGYGYTRNYLVERIVIANNLLKGK